MKSPPSRPTANSSDCAIFEAVAFLRRRQLAHGEFTTLLGADRQMSNPVFDGSPFVTSFVLAALIDLARFGVEDIVTKAASFLLSEMEFGGVWRYWSTRQHKHCRLPPDLDDTSCISYALRRAGYSVPDNRWAFSGTRDAAGRFKTWILPREQNRLTPWFLLARAAGFCQAYLRTRSATTPLLEDPRFRVMQIDRGDVDPVVNANAVLYLGESADTRPAIEFIIAAVRDNRATWSLYYEDRLALYHAVARAFHHSAPALSAARADIVEQILERCQRPGLLNPLQSALAASTLLTFEPAAPSVQDLLRSILESQRDDGGWDAYCFYNVWGSEELTTGLCIEALALSQSIE